MSRDPWSRIQLLASALLFSTGGAAVKATTLTNWQVAGGRAAVAAVALLLLVPAARRNWNWHAILVGLAYAATMILFVTANKLTTAANAIFLQATAPLYLLLLGPWLLREHLRKSDLYVMIVLAAGMSLFFVGEQAPLATAPNPWLGNMAGALSGLTWALIIVGFRWIERTGGNARSGMAAALAGNLIACLVCMPLALPVASATPTDWMLVGYLGVFQVGLAYAFLVRGIGRVPALETSLILLAEPAFNPVWAWLVHAEHPSHLALLGGALILVGSIGSLLLNR